ncbi:ABC transporter permease subunit, partial [Siminovitchia fortis]
GQTEAGIALNMTRWQRMRLVILPQAFRLMLPGFGNNAIELLKGTSLVSLVTLADLTFQGRVLKDNYTGDQIEI